ncbi:MAG: energy-coupled thiamine transporter ThiT [Butyrivibrio sp.]|nr:energy-coupled thiamine transporter ThiT [Butyrivibrio sp.]
MSLFLEKIVEDGYTSYNVTPFGYGLFIVIIVAAMIVASFFTNSESKNRFSTKQLVFSAVCMALAFVTSMIKLIDLPMGGSVTLFSMFFITFIGYLYGPRTGFTASIAYGFLQLIADPYIISIPQLFCDYIFAFGILGVSGFFASKKYGLFKGYIAGVIGRFIFSVISGVIFFADYAPEGMSPLGYSMAYNGSYLAAEALLTIVVCLVPAVRSALLRLKVMANETDLKVKVSIN